MPCSSVVSSAQPHVNSFKNPLASRSTLFLDTQACCVMTGASRQRHWMPLLQSSLILLLATPQSASAEQPPRLPERVNEPYAGDWQVLQATKACQRNDEDIKPAAAISGVESPLRCMQICERRWGCLAVDYYAKTKYCNIYRNVCSNPAAEHDGASSYRLKLPTSWEVLSTTAACATAKHVHEQRGVQYSSACKDLCERRSGCLAVDFYRSLGLCRLFTEACASPQIRRDGSESYAIRRSVAWAQTKVGKGCESNEDRVQILDKQSQKDGGAGACKSWCANKEKCRGVDYYEKTGWCMLYEHACVRPKAAHDGVSSWHVVREGMEQPTSAPTSGLLRREKEVMQKFGADRADIWSAIDSKKACQQNDEGIKHFSEIQGNGGDFGLTECQQMCENHGKCTAVDWYRGTQYCMLYEDACENAHAGHDGASSYRIVRSDLLRSATVIDQKHREMLQWREHMMDRLKALDERGAGFVNVPDFSQVIQSSKNRNVTEDDMEGIIGEIAINENSLVNYEDALGLVQGVIWS